MKYLLFLLGVFAPYMCVAAGAEDIQLVTPTGTIHGTVLLPDAATPPVVLIIAGSGPTDRNGNSALLPTGNDSLKMLAEALASAGFASVRYDKRGIAASRAAGPAEADLRFEHYVEDAAAWVAQLSGDARFSALAIVGHSEGSLIGMLAAQQANVPFISIAGASDDAATLIRRQLKDRLPLELATRNEEILSELEAGRTVTEVPLQMVPLYRSSVQPYLISWIKYEPGDEIAKLTAPCLILQGTTDIQVNVADAEALHTANSACELKIIDGMNHVMKAVSNDVQLQAASYGDPTLPLAPGLGDILLNFLNSASQPVPDER